MFWRLLGSASRAASTELTSTEPLDYLHAAVVLSLAWEPLREDGRVLRLDAQCDADAGHPDWNGRKVSVRLLDVVLANHFVFGAVAHGHRFAVRFHSGSLLEGLCRRVSVVL